LQRATPLRHVRSDSNRKKEAGKGNRVYSRRLFIPVRLELGGCVNLERICAVFADSPQLSIEALTISLNHLRAGTLGQAFLDAVIYETIEALAGGHLLSEALPLLIKVIHFAGCQYDMGIAV
jgi:hypothetical protein